MAHMVSAASAAAARVESEAIKNTHVEVQQGEGDVDFNQVADSFETRSNFDILLRELPDMMSAKFPDFLTPSPCQQFDLIYAIEFMPPPTSAFP